MSKAYKKSSVILGITLFTWCFWLAYFSPSAALAHLIEYWQISITMIFGSIIAGATSVGGGAIAFPVFTKVLHISPYDSKIFSLAIQSVGMGAAALTIYFTRTAVDWKVIILASFGGFFGIALGMGIIAPLLPPDIIKMSFSLMLASFAATLWFINKHERDCHNEMPHWHHKEKAVILFAGFLGGIMSGLVGNGIDIFVFAALVLLFRMDEKTATLSSVVLMGINAFIGFMLQLFWFQDFPAQVQAYWLAAIPVVVIGAPFGAMLCTRLPRIVIANLLIGLIAIELTSSLLLITLRPAVIYASLIMLTIFSLLNYGMYRIRHYDPNFAR